jgi:hypothetical protein
MKSPLPSTAIALAFGPPSPEGAPVLISACAHVCLCIVPHAIMCTCAPGVGDPPYPSLGTPLVGSRGTHPLFPKIFLKPVEVRFTYAKKSPRLGAFRLGAVGELRLKARDALSKHVGILFHQVKLLNE